jgi:glycosyltransferase involved in cell wall biosynthesis
MSDVRVIALLATYNEARFITGCLEHLISQGVDVYLIDNDSTDGTVELAEPFLGRGLVGIERLPRDGVYRWGAILRRKEELAESLDGDWYVHLDADEIRLAPRARSTLAEAFAEVDAQGYNCVNFAEFTFVPTLEHPDHDRPDFRETMRWYYPYKTGTPHGLKAWKRPAPRAGRRLLPPNRRTDRAELAWSGGHRIRFRGMRVAPESFPMRHYLFLSIPHAIEKYVERRFDAAELESGWHQWRARISADALRLPSESELRPYRGDDALDPSDPRMEHYVAQWIGPGEAPRRG